MALLYFEGCPNWKTTESLPLDVMDELGVASDRLVLQRVETPEEAAHLSFHGSPTVLVNGVDPFAEPHAAVGLACRPVIPQGDRVGRFTELATADSGAALPDVVAGEAPPVRSMAALDLSMRCRPGPTDGVSVEWGCREWPSVNAERATGLWRRIGTEPSRRRVESSVIAAARPVGRELATLGHFTSAQATGPVGQHCVGRPGPTAADT